MWKQAWNDARFWRRIVALIVMLGLGALVVGWRDGGLWLWVGAVCFAASLSVLALYLARRLPVPYELT
jgi:hypothetical protein